MTLHSKDDVLDPGLCVPTALGFLSIGNSYMSLGDAFRVSRYTISLVGPDTCRAIVAPFGGESQKMEGWMETANRFQESWNAEPQRHFASFTDILIH